MKRLTSGVAASAAALMWVTSSVALAEASRVPMNTVIEDALSRHPGLYLAKAELDRERDRLVYEVELAGADGQTSELHFDALSGEMVHQHEEYDDDYDGMPQPLSYAALAERVRAVRAGDFKEIELDEERGRWVYEVRVATTDGASHRMFLDAATGESLEGNWD